MKLSQPEHSDYLELCEVGTWHWICNQSTVHINSHLSIILGIGEESSDISMDEFLHYFSEDDRIQLLEVLNGSDGNFRFQFFLKKPVNRWVQLRGKTARKSGTSSHVVTGTCVDIGRPGFAHEQFSHMRELLEQSNEIAQIGWWELDLETNEVFWSKVTKAIHGVDYSFKPNLKNVVRFYTVGDQRKVITKLIDRAIEFGESYDQDFQILTAQKEVKWVRVVGTPINEGGKCIRLYGLIQDIDEQRNAIIQIQQQDSLFRNTFENASIGIALVGLNGEWLEVNSSICQMVGYTDTELRKLTFQDITHPDDLQTDLQLLNDLVDGKIDHYEMEKRYFHKKGHTVWVLLSVSIVRNEVNEPVHFISQITDISDRKKAEQEREALLGLTQKQNERLLNFAHIVSHNLRSNTGNLSMLLEIMEVEGIDFANHEYFQMMKDATTQLDGTINQLNDVISFQSLDPKEQEPIDLHSSVSRCMDQLNAYIQQSGATINNLIPPGTKVSGISAYLNSIFNNLLTNAIKYKSNKRPLVVDITSFVTDDKITIQVSDNGMGIDLDLHKDKIFGLFQTLHHSGKDAKGIGLFLTKNQMEAMGGTIEVESQLDKGTTFKLGFR